jgi:hypothetical protein
MEIKDLIIFLLIFISIMWLQYNDDKKFNKQKRESLVDIIKIPLFVSLIILIVKDLNCKLYDNFESIFILSEDSLSNLDLKSNVEFNNISGFNNVSELNISGFNNVNSVLNDIFIGPPDF